MRLLRAPGAYMTLVWLGWTALLLSVLRHPTELTLVACACFLMAGVTQVRSCRLGIVSPFPLCVLSSAAYIVPVLLTIVAGGVLTDSRMVAPEGLTVAGQLSVLAMGSLVTTYGVVGYLAGRERRVQTPRRPLGLDAFLAGGVLLGLGSAAALLFIAGAGGPAQLGSVSYGERYLLMEGRGPLLALVPYVGLAGILLYAVSTYGRFRPVGLPLVGLALLLMGYWTLLLGSRSALVHLLVGLLVVRHSRGRPLSLPVLGLTGIGLAGALLLYGALGRNIRPDPELLTSEVVLRGLNPANGEFGSSLGTIADIVRAVPRVEPFRLGLSYAIAPASLVPQVVWPGRPLAPGQWYSATFYPAYWAGGGAYAFSPVAEAYLNFGPLGVLGGFALLGWLLFRLERWLREEENLPPWGVVGLAVAAPYLLTFPRLDSVTILKSLVVIGLGGVIATVAAATLLRVLLPSRPHGVPSEVSR